MSIEKVILEKMKAMMKAAGVVSYALKMEDGSIDGDLPILVQPDGKGRRKRKLKPSLVPKYDHLTLVRGMKIGDKVKINADDREEARRLATAMGGAARRVFGQNNYITRVEGSLAQIARIG